MARKKKKKAGTYRRRRVGAAKGNTMKVLETGAIALVAGVGLTMLAQQLFPTMDSKIKGAAIAGIGVLVAPMLLKGDMGNSIAIGSVVAGGTMVLRGLGVISGVGLPYPSSYSAPRISGPGVNAMVNGPGVNTMVNGNRTVTSMVNGNSRRRSRAFDYM